MPPNNPPPRKSQAHREPSEIVAIDPGLSGAAFFIDPRHPSTGEAVDLPVHNIERGGKNKRELDLQGLVQLLSAQPIEHAFVERVSAMPGQGTVSMFSFGRTYGAILGVLAALEVPVTLVTSVQWKRVMRVPKGKSAARSRASQLLPRCADQWPLVKHDGRAEAALLALFGLREMTTFAATQPAEKRPRLQSRAAR